ncbi:MAG: septal ring lytic transglycosylase RlpA family protein, partial [Steroidobacter sp.]
MMPLCRIIVQRYILPTLMVTLSACTTNRVKPVPDLSPAEVDQIQNATPRTEPLSKNGNPAFYDALGKRYFVMPSAAGYEERGVASWYGPGFHEGSTSSGERYDMYGMTAAHKTLPLPTYVQVTNLSNGRSIVVRVNDRGPFKEGRIIDLSYTAAAKLDMLRNGTAFVEVKALVPGENASHNTSTTSNLFVQAGAFSGKANAERLLNQLRQRGFQSTFIRDDVVNG